MTYTVPSGKPTTTVYIAHQLRGDWLPNIEKARGYALIGLRHGYAPVAPYMMGLALDDEVPEDRRAGIAWDLAMIERCDEMWLCGPKISEGMREEMHHAEYLGLRVIRMPTTEAAELLLSNRQALQR